MDLPQYSDGPKVPRGEELAQIVSAVEKLNTPDTSTALTWAHTESWPGVIFGVHLDNSQTQTKPAAKPPKPTPAMYWVQKCYIGGGNTEDPVTFYQAQDDEQQFYGVTNVPELATGTHNADPGANVIVHVMIDRGSPSRKRYLMHSQPQTIWGMVTKALPALDTSVSSTDGSGGMYNFRPLSGRPKFVNPIRDLWIPADVPDTNNPDAGKNTGESLSGADDDNPLGTDTAIVENSLEADLSPSDQPSHWIPWGKIVPASFVKYATNGKPVYRCAFPKPGHQSYKIIAPQSGAGAGGSGRYKANPIYSRPTSVVLVDTGTPGLALPDHGETYAPPGSDEDDSIVNPALVCVEDVFSNNIIGHPGHWVGLLPTDGTACVIGYFTGGYSDGTDNGGIPTPIIRCYAPPQQVTIAVTVEDDGSGANASYPGPPWPAATYKYNVKTLGGLLILEGVSPVCARPQGTLLGAATKGLVTIYPNGTLTLWWVDEQADIEACP